MHPSSPLRSRDDPRPPPFSAETLWAGAYQQHGADFPFFMCTQPTADEKFQGRCIEAVPCGKPASEPAYLSEIQGGWDRTSGLHGFYKSYAGAAAREMNPGKIHYIGSAGEIAGRAALEGLWSFPGHDGTFFMVELPCREDEPGVYVAPAAHTIGRLGCFEPGRVASFLRTQVGSEWMAPVWTGERGYG
jgi:hypothetical protein